MKNKHVAATLAFALGLFGTHRFYLGQRVKGMLHFGLAMFSIVLAMTEEVPLIMLPAIIGFIDAVLLIAMPKEEFDNRYNFNKPPVSRWSRQRDFRRPAVVDQVGAFEDLYQEHTHNDQPFKRTGVAKFNLHDYEGAITDFQRALKDRYDDPALHFNLACCYSQERETMMALFHLDKAVEFGYDKFDKIHRHSALQFIRQTTQFQDFVADDYQLSDHYRKVEDALDEQPEGLELDGLIEQIKKLGELRENGILTQAEFEAQKKKLL